MKKYTVSAPVYASVGATVEAENKEDAKEKFDEYVDENVGSLCWQCASTFEVGDIDFEKIIIDEVE